VRAISKLCRTSGETLFNWYSAPTFAAMLLFWVLGAYVLTRSPRSAVSLTAVGAQFATALYLLGQGMLANADTIDQWMPWARNLEWGAHAAPLLWYWLTVLLLREQRETGVGSYLRWVCYPLGVLLTILAFAFTISIYVDDALNVWSAVSSLPAEKAQFSRFNLPNGPLYIGFLLYLAGSTLTALANVAIAWRRAASDERRRCLGWLLVSAVLLAVGANTLGLFNWAMDSIVPTWVGHGILGVAMVVMAWNVAAYSLLFRGQVVRKDFFYALTGLGLVVVLYGAVLLVTGASYSFQLLGLIVVTLSVAILSHAFVDLGRGLLDPLFFGPEVQSLRNYLSWGLQNAARTPNLQGIIDETKEGLAQVEVERLYRLTEQALKRLNDPSMLSRAELSSRIPATLDQITRESHNRGLEDVTPLERAQAMRAFLISGIERLKPIDGSVGLEAPAALQYHILHEEYVDGLENKNIQARHNIGEGTFNRNRQRAIQALVDDLARQEQLAARTKAAAFGVSGAASGS
jgi:hypothetical protein